MAVVKVYDQDKTEQGELTLTPEVFEVAVRPEILHLVPIYLPPYYSKSPCSLNQALPQVTASLYQSRLVLMLLILLLYSG